MLYSILVWLPAIAWAMAGSDTEPNEPAMRISADYAVARVYRDAWGKAREAWGRPSSGRGLPFLILAVWEDGRIVWSSDRLRGGAPFRAGRVEPQKVAALLSRFENDGLFDDEDLKRDHSGPDSSFICIGIKSGQKVVNMRSRHELIEASDKLDELRKRTADYLFYRVVWSETRGKLTDLIPVDSVPVTAKLVGKGGVLRWEEVPGKTTPAKP